MRELRETQVTSQAELGRWCRRPPAHGRSGNNSRVQLRPTESHSSSPKKASSLPCDQTNSENFKSKSAPTVIIRAIPMFLAALIPLMLLASWTMAAASPATTPNEYQLMARAGGQARLPCLIGKQVHCGEPYFIAWYKLNGTSRQWSRIEARSLTASEEQAAPLADRIQFVMSRTGEFASSCLPSESAINDSFASGGGGGGSSQKSLASRLFDCGQLTIKALELADEGQYKCEITFSESLGFDSCPASTMTQLNVIARPSEPEILLNGKPALASPANAGDQMIAAPPTESGGGNTGASLTFKEGAQVRLECQSAGGKPAPRIEWLNLTGGAAIEGRAGRNAGLANDDNDDQSMTNQQQQPSMPPQLQVMRLYWPIKRTTYSIPAESSQSTSNNNNINQVNQQQQRVQIPVTSSSITITLSRFDLRSRFVCLVVPADEQAHGNKVQNDIISLAGLVESQSSKASSKSIQKRLLSELPASVRDPQRLAELLDRVGMLEAASARRQTTDENLPLLKWIKLNVQVKPSSVSVRVLDLSAHSLVRASQHEPSGLFGRQPIYSLQPNRLYAIQCLVENSRPRSQVVWFNRTAPIELIQQVVQSSGPDYLVSAQADGGHRLSSFVRYAELESGAFRTIASLLLTTSFQDNFDELFCRVSNDAFQFDELAQVAPIISARLHVNYPPSAWLEAPDAKWTTATTTTATSQAAAATGRLSGELGRRVQMRCWVGANPLMQNTILQIDWLKDGRRLAASSILGQQRQQSRQQHSAANNSAHNNNSSSSSSIQIEKTNHLHMPLVNQQPQMLDLADRISADQQHFGLLAGRLLTSSSLTISSLSKADAGRYSCQFKLIPAPSGPVTQQQQQQVGELSTAGGLNSQLWQQQQQQLQQVQQQQSSVASSSQQMKIISGQANQSIQLNVIEAKLPIVQVASSSGLLVYNKDLEVVVSSRRAKVTLRCDFPYDTAAAADKRQFELGHKVLWHLNGAFLHSSSSDQLELDLSSPPKSTDDESGQLVERLLSGNGGRLSCAHQLLEPNSLLVDTENFHAKAMRLFASSNELDLRFKVEPKMLRASKSELLMPAYRSFSELELVAQPLNRLKLVCFAQCEPLCSIDWFANGQPVRELQLFAGGGLDPFIPKQGGTLLRELVDNQTRIFKGLKKESDSAALLEIENLIHRKTMSSSERFPWYKQTAHISVQLPEASEFDSATRDLMRDSYELIQSSGPEVAASNVFSKLVLSYHQLSQMLMALNSPAQKSALDSRSPQEDSLLLECRLSEFLDSFQFHHMHVAAQVFHPKRVNAGGLEEASEGLSGDLSVDPSETDELKAPSPQVPPKRTMAGLVHTFKELNLSALFVDQRDKQAGSLSAQQTRVILEKPPMTGSDNSAPATFPSNFPIALLSPQFVHTNSSSTNALNQLQMSRGGPTSARPIVQGWLLNHLELLLIVACSAAIVWLLGLFVSPLVRRHFFARSPGSAANMLKQKRASQWRFNQQTASRPSSSNEIGLFGSSHKFNGSAPNYYGAPESGGDSSEHDMVHSGSQSSHYEDFIQHSAQLPPRLAQHQQQPHQQQPLYFNQAHLVESTTLSRRPLMKTSYSSSSTSGDTNCSRQPLAASRIYGDIRQQQQQQQQQQQMHAFASTMRHAHTQVPLISGSNNTSSRINFSDLQQAARLGGGQQTFGKTAPLNAKMPPMRLPSMQTHEHIYDDVN